MVDVTPLPILYSDEHIVAIDKPAGLLAHASPLDAHNTQNVVDRLHQQIGHRAAPVHRLDRATSGVMLFALNREVASRISQQWPGVEKTYHAIIRGHLAGPLDLNHPVKDRDTGVRQDAHTRFRPLASTELDEAVDRYPSTR